MWNSRANLGKTCLKSVNNEIVHIIIIYRFGKRTMFILTIFVFMMLFKLLFYVYDMLLDILHIYRNIINFVYEIYYELFYKIILNE